MLNQRILNIVNSRFLNRCTKLDIVARTFPTCSENNLSISQTVFRLHFVFGHWFVSISGRSRLFPLFISKCFTSVLFYIISCCVLNVSCTNCSFDLATDRNNALPGWLTCFQLCRQRNCSLAVGVTKKRSTN